MLTLDQQVASACTSAPEGVTWGVAIISHEDGRTISDYRAEAVIDAASLAKLGIAYVLQQEGIALGTRVYITPEDRQPGPDILPYLPDGYEIGIGEVALHTLQHSSNTGACLLTRYLGGAGHVNEVLNDTFPHTRLEPKGPVTRANHATKALSYHGITTPLEIAGIMRHVVQNPHFAQAMRHSPFWYGLRGNIEYQSKPGPRESREAELSHWIVKRLTGSKNRHIPKGFYAHALSASRRWPPRTPYPNKEGSSEELRHDVALIGPYVIAACSVGYAEKTVYSPTHPAHIIHRQIGTLALRALCL